MGLLRAAADAAARVAYDGRRFLTTWNRGASGTSQVTVEHRPGEGVRYRSAAGLGGYRPDSAAESTGFTAATLALLTRNYSVVRAADGSACGRSARVVEARRADGTPAGRFWLDSETGLMLRRELIDGTGRRVVATGFTEISFTARGDRLTLPAAPPARGADRIEPDMKGFAGTTTPWEERLAADDLNRLRADGWPAPRVLPGRLSLYDARRDGGTLHLSYSDGLAAVSVFVQRGALDRSGVAGWQKTVRRGRTVFRRESLRRWAVSAGGGYVYTVLTDVPQSTAEAVALNLPRDHNPFWTRLSRGARRLGSAVNPFD
ncbi:MucB/RseB C-terminal domain-containing protein [Actinomadura roseirufa]|uniref:MucB/RseB C-terminal domain-containing protein n=1 Tax=Actinomadura roseirufa TaxID=2094049 RepID=UPI0010410F54|nr:MucB/RseB C-terminal domain-containing protein [Actinomadura roseirufa]